MLRKPPWSALVGQAECSGYSQCWLKNNLSGPQPSMDATRRAGVELKQ